MMIHAIGDSHVGMFNGYDEYNTGNIPNPSDGLKHFRTYPIIPILAEYLGFDSPARRSLFSIVSRLPSGDTILLSAGEVDIRTEVVRKVNKEYTPLDVAVQIHIERYRTGIRHLKECGRKLIVYSPFPIHCVANDYHFCKDTLDKIWVANREWDTQLTEMAKQEDIYHFSCVQEFVDKGMNLKRLNYNDWCHVKGIVAWELMKEYFQNTFNIDITERQKHG